VLRVDREHHRWRRLATRLDEVTAYLDEGSDVQATELPARAKRMGLRVGVLTHSPRWYAERLLDAFAIPRDALISGSDGYSPKPDPGSLRAIAEELGVAVGDCVMVGDDAADVGAAHNAGMRCIGVSWARRAPQSWRRRWPDIAVARPDDLVDALCDANPRRPFAEAALAGDDPVWHWGSLLRLGKGVFGTGCYYTQSDGRHPGHALSRLIIRTKEDEGTAG
jgi:HAD superfamily hydrolase (TIGR01549 family)